ncbi:MAG TPA: SRPBCC family protein [Chthoniobacterales bacterium]|nr:SRPBCC family protein [Chthoniobacterales bacterium]
MNINVPQPERIGSVAVGVGIAAYGLSRRSLGGVLLALLGGALIKRGATGHCEMYSALGINSRQLNTETGVPGNKGIKVVKSVTVGGPAQEVYRYWRKLENLAQFMNHVKSVTQIDERRSTWVVKGPMGTELGWTAQILADREGELLAWESLPGAEVQNAGSVRFETVGDRQTEVRVSLQYNPPGGALGALGATVAKLFGENPEQQLEEDLARFKTIIEREAAAAVAGQNDDVASAGTAGTHTGATQ